MRAWTVLQTSEGCIIPFVLSATFRSVVFCSVVGRDDTTPKFRIYSTVPGPRGSRNTEEAERAVPADPEDLGTSESSPESAKYPENNVQYWAIPHETDKVKNLMAVLAE